jgi:hypothetical protein
MLRSILSWATIGLYAFFFGISLLQLIAPWEGQVSGKTFVDYHQAIDPYMAKWAKLLAQLQLVLTLLVLVTKYQQGLTLAFWLMSIAFGLVVTSVLVAIRGNVPLNEISRGWSPDELPVDWLAIRSRWISYHRTRAFINILGFGFSLAGLLAGQV